MCVCGGGGGGGGGGEGGLQAKLLRPCCCIRDSLKFDMQHDIFLKKKKIFDPRGSGGGGWVGVCGQNICYLVAAFVTLFNLICNMTMF